MSTETYATCPCCGDENWRILEENVGPLCYSCRMRGGLCLHNLNDHLEQGAHRTKPHRDASGAADPSTCRWCLAERSTG